MLEEEIEPCLIHEACDKMLSFLKMQKLAKQKKFNATDLEIARLIRQGVGFHQICRELGVGYSRVKEVVEAL